jgi:hypothetical protein
MITFPAPVFERDDLFVFALLDNFGRDLPPIADLSAIDVHQHFEGGGFAGFDVEKIDIHRVAFRDAILPATSLDNCVSHKVIFRGEKAAQGVTEGLTWQGETLQPIDYQHNFAFGRVGFVMGEELGGAALSKFLKFLG